MTVDEGRKPDGAPERSAKAGEGAPSGVDANGPKRFSVQRKMAVVSRLLRGEPLDLVARDTNVSVAKLTEWRERALEGAASRAGNKRASSPLNTQFRCREGIRHCLLVDGVEFGAQRQQRGNALDDLAEPFAFVVGQWVASRASAGQRRAWRRFS
jgi:hypothetical protein